MGVVSVPPPSAWIFMRPIKIKKGRNEAEIQSALVSALPRGAWTIVDKTHGNSHSAGWPDLYCYHQVRQLHRWVEVKAPGGSFTPAQRARFARWQIAGLGVYVMCDADISVLFTKEPNWREWL